MEDVEGSKLLARNTDFMAACAQRKSGEQEPIIRCTRWVAELPKTEQKELLSLIFGYDSWTEQTDPTGTHASGVIQFNGHYVIWNIGKRSMDPPGVMSLAPAVLCLTISHSSEV